MRKLTLFLAAVSLVLFAEKALCYETTFTIEPDSFKSFRYEEMRVEEVAPLSIRTGRFLSVDPKQNWLKAAANPQAWNRYAYARNNPIRLVDPDGQDDKDFRILTARVNVIYSNADVKISGGQTLRQVTEQGIAYSRSFFADAGIKLDVRRFEGTINTRALGNMNSPVKTANGDVALSDFTKSQKGAVNVLVSGDLGGTTGLTAGVGGPTIIGTGSDKMVFNEKSHMRWGT